MKRTKESLVVFIFVFTVPVLVFLAGCSLRGSLLPDLITSVPSNRNWTISGTGSGTRQHTRSFTEEEFYKLEATVSLIGGSASLTLTQGGNSCTTQLHGFGISAEKVEIDKTGISHGSITMKAVVSNITSGSVIISW